ncbi:hypothetical protein A2Y85_01395 [candidate division WOR-3 bacterium RBG_13_43_14]|uniref:Uncharacterized protein n=1 Tax=candidate division WOR-3 bacterium RBG_13_43_14 TaxID=1802590 RepID=A0A1F4U6D9_UNCW3|nr:MAG: hypothetical protein A2Y85_01395 [candidate division WOR-3 bacterium RBG_13_43_14]
MNTKSIHLILFVVLIALIACDNRIIERAASDYFPFKDSRWWVYYNGQDTVYIEVLDPDTTLGQETMTVSFGGDIKHWIKSDAAIEEYVEILYYHTGIAYPVIQDFFVRNELPLVNGYVFSDSIVDSIMISGITVKADFSFESRVVGFQYQDDYDADIYHISYQMVKTLDSPDTTVINAMTWEEYYAPGVGIVRFVDSTGDYSLIDYHID